MARSKPNPHIVESREQAEGTMAEIAAPLKARRKELESGLAVFAKLNRSTLFPGKSKSLDLGFGVIGFQASSKIVQQNGIEPAVTLDRLHKFGFVEGIRTKEEINRDAMTDWTAEKLETVGLRRQKSDGFFVDVKEEAVPSP